jgi:hypothetical protein
VPPMSPHTSHLLKSWPLPWATFAAIRPTQQCSRARVLINQNQPCAIANLPTPDVVNVSVAP